MQLKPAFRVRPCEHRFFSVPPAILLSLILGAAILPFLLLRSAQRLRNASWEHMLWGVSAWLWIVASVLAMGLIMVTGWGWRRVATWLRRDGPGRTPARRSPGERDTSAPLPVVYQR